MRNANVSGVLDKNVYFHFIVLFLFTQKMHHSRKEYMDFQSSLGMYIFTQCSFEKKSQPIVYLSINKLKLSVANSAILYSKSINLQNDFPLNPQKASNITNNFAHKSALYS